MLFLFTLLLCPLLAELPCEQTGPVLADPRAAYEYTKAPAMMPQQRTHFVFVLVLQSQIGDPEKWQETWSVQLFRSIDSSSAAGLSSAQDTLKAGLSARGTRIVEFGIQVPFPSHICAVGSQSCNWTGK